MILACPVQAACFMITTRDGAHMFHMRRGRQQHDFTVGLGQVVTPLDPRIHFALVCGAKSCPPIKVYTAEALEEGLEAAAAAFCESASPRAELPFCL